MSNNVYFLLFSFSFFPRDVLEMKSEQKGQNVARKTITLTPHLQARKALIGEAALVNLERDDRRENASC